VRYFPWNKEDAMGYATELDRCFIESLEYCK